MAQVITIAGERLFALKAQNNEQLDIDTFIFANVPGQDPNATIDRNEGLPPVAQRVHQQIVQQVGRINDNVVVYSTVLDSVTGPFDFNWVGLYSSANQTLIAVSHIPNVSKTITAPGTAGNTLNRNFGIEYSGIADLAGITVQPETWQLDFTARLSGMDELTRQLAADMNGKDWFIEDGFKVVPRSTTNTFKVTPGAGYVSGLRVELNQDHILTLQSYPQFVYVDAWFDGDASSQWKPKTAFTVTNGEMDDYIDVNGKQHYVFKLARITAADVVEDLRNTNGLNDRLKNVEDNFKEGQATEDVIIAKFNGNNDLFQRVDSQLQSPQANNDIIIKSNVPYSVNTLNKSLLEYFTNQAQLNVNGWYWGGNNGGVSVLGDSISQAAFAINNYENLWVNIVKRNTLIDFESDSFGFVTLWDKGSMANTPDWKGEVHTVTVNTAWKYLDGASASNSPSGFSYRASGAGAGRTMSVLVPCFQNKFAIWGHGDTGFGSLSVKVNGTDVTVANFDTGSNTNQTLKLKADDYNLKDRGDGFCLIEMITNSSATVELFGLSYENEDNCFQFNNFSHSGRRLRQISNIMINRVVGGANTLILALGHNDQGECDNDDYLYQELVTVCDNLIKAVNLFNTKLIICDFIWHETIQSSRTRKLIHDMQFFALKSVYLPFPDYFTINQDHGYPYTKENLKLFEDYSHPNIRGHKIIGETVSKALNLSNSSKNPPIEKMQFFPINISESGLIGKGDQWPFVTAMKISDQQLHLQLNVGYEGGGVIPKGAYRLINIGVGDQIYQRQPATVSMNDEQYGNAGINDNALVVPAVIELKQNGDLVLTVKETISSDFINLTEISGSYIFNLQRKR